MWRLRRKPGETIEFVIPPAATSRRITVENVGGTAANLAVAADSDVGIIRGESPKTRQAGEGKGAKAEALAK